MTPADWKNVASEVEALYGRTGKWAKADASFKYAKRVPAAAAFRALEEIYLEGRSIAPPPAEILGRASKSIENVTTPDEIRRFCSGERHLFGIVGEENKIRTVVCGRCGFEEDRPAHLAPTEGEIENGVYTGKPADITERIAP